MPCGFVQCFHFKVAGVCTVTNACFILNQSAREAVCLYPNYPVLGNLLDAMDIELMVQHSYDASM